MAEIKISKSTDNRIKVIFPYNPSYIAKIKTIKGYKWHPEEKYWSFPTGDGIVEKLASVFDGEKLDIDPSLGTPKEEFEYLRRELVSRKYSPKTIKAYIHYNRDFLRFIEKKPEEAANDDIKNYLFHLADKRGLSAFLP